jgi:hypothetical protein
LEQGKDAVVGKADNAASGAQPTENVSRIRLGCHVIITALTSVRYRRFQKSYTQQAGDAIGGSSNNSQG